MPKKYYWFKMRADFFDSREIKRLQKIPGGDTYIVLYINLLSRSVKTEGCLHFDHVEATFAEELALILDSNADAVNFLLKFLYQYNLLTIDGDNYYFIEAVSHIGTESESAERTRQYRARKKLQQLSITSTGSESKLLSSPSQCDKKVTVDKSPSQCDDNVTHQNERHDVTDERHFVTETHNKVTDERHFEAKRHIVHTCDTEIEKEIDIEPSSSTKVNIDVSKPVDNFGLPVANGFNAFMQCYPRNQANQEAVYQVFCQLVSQGTAISDLIAAAKNYADAVRKNDVDMRYIKMPANFLRDQVWLKYTPKFQLDCPTCHGNGIVDYPPSDAYPNGHVEFCHCEKRYKSLDSSNALTEILAKLHD